MSSFTSAVVILTPYSSGQSSRLATPLVVFEVVVVVVVVVMVVVVMIQIIHGLP